MFTFFEHIENNMINQFYNNESEMKTTITGKIFKIIEIIVVYYFVFHLFACSWFYVGFKESADGFSLKTWHTDLEIPAEGWIKMEESELWTDRI